MAELVLVFLVSSDMQTWTPIDREEIPEWLVDADLIEYMIGGGTVRNTFQDAEQKAMKWYACTSVDRLHIKPSAILLPPRLVQGNRLLLPESGIH